VVVVAGVVLAPPGETSVAATFCLHLGGALGGAFVGGIFRVALLLLLLWMVPSSKLRAREVHRTRARVLFPSNLHAPFFHSSPHPSPSSSDRVVVIVDSFLPHSPREERQSKDLGEDLLDDDDGRELWKEANFFPLCPCVFTREAGGEIREKEKKEWRWQFAKRTFPFRLPDLTRVTPLTFGPRRKEAAH